MENLVEFMNEEDQSRIISREKEIGRRVEEYINKCKEEGGVPVRINSIPEWLSMKNDIICGDVVNKEAETAKGIMVTKFKAPEFKRVIAFQEWLPKSQIDYDEL